MRSRFENKKPKNEKKMKIGVAMYGGIPYNLNQDAGHSATRREKKPDRKKDHENQNHRIRHRRI